jgi:ribosome maturation factor RimP
MRREEVERLAADMAAEICPKLGLKFIDCSYRKSDGQWRLLVRVDKENGVSVVDCTALNHLLGQRLDEVDPIEHAYTLEVASLGLSGPLRTDEDFERFLGRPLELAIRPPGGKPKRGAPVLVGRLAAYDAVSLTVETDSGPVRVDRHSLQRARPAVDFRGTGAESQ